MKLCFEVQDTGVGISHEAMQRLFAAFEQADNSNTRKYGGTGLGLAITRRLAELMGGEAGAKSTPGAGSTFWFTANLAKGEPAGALDILSGADAIGELRKRYAGKRVLVADDEPINREVAKMLLEEAGLAVDTADDGAEAVAMASQTRYAAIFMDVQMPDVDGLEATRRLRAQPETNSVPIIAITASAFTEDKTRCLAAGMSDVLIKPYHPDALFASLLHWLDQPQPPETRRPD